MTANKQVRYLFIVNPKAGKGKFKKLIPFIKKHFPREIPYDIIISLLPEESRKIIRTNFDNYDVFVAAGGDGTVNEVSSELINTEKILGVIPIGSGNGLARELGIPLDFRRALKRLRKLKIIELDTVKFNQRSFINMAGVGFDGLIAVRFEGGGKRGIGPYIKLVIQTILKYKPQNYEIRVNNEILQRKAYLISIANTSQYGGGAHICPRAVPTDGIINIVILKPFKYIMIPNMAYRLFTKGIHKSKAIEMIECKSLIIKGENMTGHTDGEPLSIENEISIVVQPRSIKVIS